jgi:hypothetical protein
MWEGLTKKWAKKTKKIFPECQDRALGEETKIKKYYLKRNTGVWWESIHFLSLARPNPLPLGVLAAAAALAWRCGQRGHEQPTVASSKQVVGGGLRGLQSSPGGQPRPPQSPVRDCSWLGKEKTAAASLPPSSPTPLLQSFLLQRREQI